jgi:hypothetical protein
MAFAIHDKLKEQYDSNVSGENALVVSLYNNEKREIEKYLDENEIKPKERDRKLGDFNGVAFYYGKKAGEQVSLNKQIDNTNIICRELS